MALDIREIAAKSALNRVTGELEFSWSLNPYRGCQHACAYCYARATHRYFNLNSGEDFSRIIFVKTNIAEQLGRELQRPGWKRDLVAVGTATDPYQPVEGRFRLTRQCLQALLARANPTLIITKGTLIERDLDLLADLAAATHLSVLMSIPTISPEIWRQSEPGTPSPAQRMRMVERLSLRGIYAGVMMAPLLPGITDTPERIAKTIQAAADHGAQFVETHLLRLAPDIRPVYAEFLDRHYPLLRPSYRKWYANGPLAPLALSRAAALRVRNLAGQQGIAPRRPYVPPVAPATQMTWKF